MATDQPNPSERARERSRKWYEANKALTIARAAKWRAENLERSREIKRDWGRNNPDKARASLQSWRNRNRGRTRALTNKWHDENAAELRRKRTQWRKDHPEEAHTIDRENNRKRDPQRSREWQRKRYQLHPEEYKAHARNRAARQKAAPGKHTAADIRHLFKIQRGQCAVCHVVLITSGKGKYHVDHIIPLKPKIGPGGTNDPSNLQLLCAPCNRSKSNKLPE